MALAYQLTDEVRGFGVRLLCRGFPKLGGTFLGVPIVRIIVFGGLYWGSPILGNYHIVYWGCIGIVEKKIKTTKGCTGRKMELYRVIEKRMESAKDYKGIYRGYMRILEKKIETIVMGLYRDNGKGNGCLGFRV